MRGEREYLRLLRRYKDLIQELYEIDFTVPGKAFKSDYTPDYMSYDLEGFYEIADEDEEDYLPELRKAVKHAKDYVRWVNSRPAKYGYTFG